jgi:uncharacterized membrane protein YkoI
VSAFVATLALLLVLAAPGTADDDERSKGDPLKKVAGLLKGAPLKLSEAVTKAESHTGGRAFASSIDTEDGATVYEVVVYVTKDGPKIVEVVVHATSGKILEVEVEYPKGKADDDDDEEDDDDDEEDDDDDEDDDD